MLVSDSLTYADIFAELENVSSELGRTINPTVYSYEELQNRIDRGNSFIRRVLAQQNSGSWGRIVTSLLDKPLPENRNNDARVR